MYCNDCGTQISDTAKACPNCGAVVSNKQTKERWTTGMFSVLMVLSVLAPIVGWVAGSIALYRRETDHAAYLLSVGTAMFLLYLGLQ